MCLMCGIGGLIVVLLAIVVLAFVAWVVVKALRRGSHSD